MFGNYFDLGRDVGRLQPRDVPPEKPAVLPQYLALAAGVIAEPLLHSYIATHTLNISVGQIWQQVVFGLIVAVVIFPGVYRNAFDPERPFLIQLCAIFASGVGWQSLFQAATGGAANIIR